MRGRTGARRGFSRLSDRAGAGAKLPTRLIDWLTFENSNSSTDLVGEVTIPAGTVMVEVVPTGGGGSGDGSLAGGAGGGSVEYRFAPASEGLKIQYQINRASAWSGQSPGPAVTVTLPSGLGTLVAQGGGSSFSSGASGGAGSGPPGSIIRQGGSTSPGAANPGQGPFGGRPLADNGGAGGAGPYGGDGGGQSRSGNYQPKPGGGASYEASNSISGSLSIKFFGEALS